MKNGPDELNSDRALKRPRIDINTAVVQSDDAEQSFLHAAESGDIHSFERLINLVNINCSNNSNETALMLAINKSPNQAQLRIISRLLDRGADTDIISLLGETALSRAKKHNLYQVINLLHNANIAHLALPNELWFEIAKYLGPEDLDHFRIICNAFMDLHEDKTDLLWQPLLNRLYAIDNYKIITPIPGKTLRETFINGFLNIVELQSDEISLVTQNHPQTLQELQIHFGHDHPITLDILERRNELLDNINCAIIQKLIDENPGNTLEIMGSSKLSRFPKKILLGKNRDYFNQLEILNLSGNHLWSIPSNINLCQNLKEFHCSANRELYELPDSICDIKSLNVLYCDYNDMEQLPNRLGELVNLKKIVCDSNQITHLPNDIGNLTQLRELDISSNRIQALPESMITILENLTDYDFTDNPFLPNEDNRIEDDTNNAYFISFIDAKKSSPNTSNASAEVDNNGDIWSPLLLELEKINPLVKLLGKNNESLRDQFIERFQYIAKSHLKMITMLSVTDHQIMQKYPVEKNTFSGELSFQQLTLNQLIKHDKQLNIDIQKAGNVRLTNKVTPSRVLLFQHNPTANNHVPDAQSDAMDIDEVPPLKQPKW